MKKVLIANRGEIAVRIIRACRDYGLQSVAVYADPDQDALFVRLADEAYALEGVRPAETYLDIAKLIAIAKRAGADAVHPGYGFLSERAEFAQAVIDAGLSWIGPDPHVIEALGDKVEARRIATGVGAPLVAGSDGPVSTAAEVTAFAEEYGLPVAIKAAHGGGGRGLKVAWKMDEIADLYESAVREATAAFGRGECFLERFLDRPRHIEAQVLADKHGNVLVLGTRDCSLQRRNQKLIEEAPAPFLSAEQRQKIHDSAKAICAAAGYSGAGTVEFLLGVDGTISFLEVNTRLQVEHPVTEETTGIDLVIEQFRIAEGHTLRVVETPEPRGHSMEFRINAEDPGRGFLPTPGAISIFDAPSGPGIRMDSGVVSGSSVPGVFDSLMAKLIVTGTDRDQVLRRARRALKEFRIEGIATVLPFHRAAIETDDFIGTDGFKVHTRWIETDFAAMPDAMERPAPAEDPSITRTFLEIDGKRVSVGLPNLLLSGLGAVSGGNAAAPGASVKEKEGEIIAPVSGTLQSFKVTNGETVSKGDLLAVMEAMKMETQIVATKAGKVRLIVKEGDYLQAGAALLEIAE
ncbi:MULTISPECIES: acetyl/propionyl/methylcrotonyl-CoA carboxylase subunit alpha [Agrobacterium]|uniref:acetyl/propionyl/methylcrotonyl-CoA carboxylase subunit alpha n=1 Tax=Agrobacterium TaxID=357 RepID=UPI0015735CCD|nr:MULTISPECIES: acetyl/propionyl/methylcrotonyl-CoA carboxylase subunit alpha [Agrobacterium]MBO9110891.1 acetyl/propionyl/methylcrotonyl-CoA carboxylase subunit alpha [Agrobacterium sp. S2/73]NTA18013.1 acetyl/propionyl/methylcrotonyl-CoA carboxylase subunit alpha [Agrobacterium tumefaciens]QXZ74847.1 acetyl/propionyl/methylcrotonyl-CoA carboxylase subunit alpha [Agrobacterium sp. S7/73]WCK73356.1 acetyl/propionyl/methylcrotonyl-CoA carboxylase subunit alpha [Agrobacterium tumefaciens]